MEIPDRFGPPVSPPYPSSVPTILMKPMDNFTALEKRLKERKKNLLREIDERQKELEIVEKALEGFAQK